LKVDIFITKKVQKGSIIKNISKDEADAVLLKVPYEGTVSGGTGAAEGPDAITEMLNYQVEYWDIFLRANIGDKVKIAQEDVDIKGMSPQDVMKEIEAKAKNCFDKGKFVVTLGGEHSVSLGSISAAKKHFENLTVLQIDAHADLRDDNSDYEDDPEKITKYAHSCVMRRVYDLGCPIVQVGIRSLSPSEAEFVEEKKIGENIFYTPISADYRKIISKCKTDKVYVTIDVDGFDPAVMPATGTPEPGGLSWDWTVGLLRELFSKKEIIGFDIVEVAPNKDSYLTEFAAAKLLYRLIGLKFLR